MADAFLAAPQKLHSQPGCCRNTRLDRGRPEARESHAATCAGPASGADKGDGRQGQRANSASFGCPFGDRVAERTRMVAGTVGLYAGIWSQRGTNQCRGFFSVVCYRGLENWDRRKRLIRGLPRRRRSTGSAVKLSAAMSARRLRGAKEGTVGKLASPVLPIKLV